MVRVLCHEKIWVGRSKKVFQITFLSGFVSTRFNNYREIVAHYMISLQPPRENRVAYSSNHIEKIIRSAEKNRVGWGTVITGLFFQPYYIDAYKTYVSWVP